MLTDLLQFVVLLVGIAVVGASLAVGAVLLISSHERQRARQAWLQLETLRAGRRVHDIHPRDQFRPRLDQSRGETPV